LLQQSFAQEKSKSVETQEVGTHSEGSSRKTKKDMASRGKEDTSTPNSSQPIKKSVTKKFVMGDIVISRKKIATQFQRVSSTSVQRGKRQKEGSKPCGQLDNVPKTIMEMPSKPASQIEKTPDFQLQSKKKSTPAEASSSVLFPKDQRSQNKKQKKETDQQGILLEPTIKPPPKSPKELKSISEVTWPSQSSVGGLKETTKVTSKNRKKLEGKEAQGLDPTPQSSRLGIRVCQQKKTP
jgi:hypothetical protein